MMATENSSLIFENFSYGEMGGVMKLAVFFIRLLIHAIRYFLGLQLGYRQSTYLHTFVHTFYDLLSTRISRDIERKKFQLKLIFSLLSVAGRCHFNQVSGNKSAITG